MAEAKLKAELDYYEKNRTDWLKEHEGKFVLIQGEKTGGFFDTEHAAYEAGVDQFGGTPFFIKQVTKEDTDNFIPALACGVVGAVA
jgi:hypothetical protein